MAEGEVEPHAEGSLAIADELAGGVVNGRNVVGVKGVPYAERVCQHAGTHAEEARLVDVVVTVQRSGQHAPAENVQAEDEQRHPTDAGPFPRGQAGPDPSQARGQRLRAQSSIRRAARLHPRSAPTPYAHHPRIVSYPRMTCNKEWVAIGWQEHAERLDSRRPEEPTSVDVQRRMTR